MLNYKVLTANANTPEWLRARKQGGLGASEVAAVLGLSKWSTPLGVYLNKLTDDASDDMTEWQEWGHRLEEPIAGWVEDTQGLAVIESPGLIQSEEYPWLMCTPDRVTDNGEPLELKTSDRFMASDWELGVPDNYRIQVLVQMIVLGARKGYLAVLHGGNRPEFHVIDWDQEAADQIIRITREFWEGHVLAKVPPEPVTSSEAALAYPTPADVPVEGGEALYEAWGAYGLLQAEQVDIAERIEAMKLTLQKAMADATALTYEGKPLFTWKPRKGSARLDTAALKAAHPDIYAQFIKQGEPTRTFLRKTVKEFETND